MTTKNNIVEEKELLTEDRIENILMVAGFVPIIGEVADIVLIIRYIIKKEYLYAALMLVALIPTVGDLIAKPLIKTLRLAGVGSRVALRNGDDLVRVVGSNPAAKQQLARIGQHLNNANVTKTVGQIEKIPRVGRTWAGGLKKGLTELGSAIGRLKPVRAAKGVAKGVKDSGKFGLGYKKFFQDQALTKYVAKHGMEPQTWMSRWWHVVRKGRKDRRDMIKHFVISNKLLEFFNLPNFNAFRRRFETDPEFRAEVANHPGFSEMVSQSVSPAELAQIESGARSSGGAQGGGGNIFGAVASLTTLKMLAKMYV